MSSNHFRFMKFAAALVACLAAFTVPGDAEAQQCISAKAKKNLSTCPGGKFQAKVTKRPEVSFKSAPEKIKKKERQTRLKPVNPTDIAKTAQRDERRARLKPKVRRLLVTEIANVERLYRSTKRRSKDRPRLMRRLAEGYVELESSAFRDKVEAEVKAQTLRSSNPGQASKYKKKAQSAKGVIKVARKSAIKYYKKLKKQYPNWCQFPKQKEGHRGCIDEVLYYLAYEYEQAGKLDDARNAYLELTEKWKKSRFVPNAYLAFGELFFNDAQTDPGKWPIAENFYKEVLKYPPPDNKLWGYGQYKLAYVYWNQGKYGEAIDGFKAVIEFGKKFSSIPNAAGLADSARRDIIPVYALKGDPKKAYSFFKPLSGDKGGSTKKTFKMMEDLGDNLMDTGHYPEAVVLYQDLMKRNRGDNYCKYETQISKAVMASLAGNKPPIVVQLKKQLTTYKSFIKANHSSSSKLACANKTAGLLTETAMAWHLEAVGSQGVRGTGDKNTMKLSAELYDVVVNNFTSGDFAKFKFPRIVREDWPTISKIRYAMADLLYFQKDWAKCGPAFDAVVAEDPNGPNAAEAAFASVLCYQNIYAMRHKDGSHRKGGGNLPSNERGKKGKKESDKFKPKPFTKEQKGMITAFNRYVCYIKPPKGDKEAEEQYVEVKYARARTYFEAQHWEEASEAFRDIAINHPKLDAAIYAAQLYLESLNIIGSKLDPAKPSCYDNMEKDVPVFIKNFCEGKKKDENEEQCSVLFRIQRDIERLQAEQLVKQADAGGADRIKKYEKAANLYLNLWKKYGKEACLEKKPACAKNEEILYNAARAFQAARLIAKAISVRRILIDEQYNLHKTEPAKKAVYEIGGNYQAIAVYDLAASWYERFAAESPKMEKAPDALSDAVVLRLGLGQQDKAIADARLFQRRYGRKRPAAAAQIAFAIGAHYAERNDWRNAEKALRGGPMRQIDANANVDVKIQAHALLGRIFARQKKVTNADGEYNKVRATWKNPQKTIDAINKLGGAEAQRLRRLAKVLTAVGEAYYHFAAKFRAKADKMKFPVYKGSGERKDVQKFIGTKVKTWMNKKRPAIEAAEKEYLKIVKLKPAPPPRWVIAAGAAVGGMWGQFVAEFRAAPYPKEWDKPGDSPFGDPNDPSAPPLRWSEIRAQYLSSLDAASEKEKRRAKGAYITCLGYSVKYQYFDQDSRSCEKWLSKTYPAEFHLIDEFRGSPNRVNSGLDERPLPLGLDGAPITPDTRQAEDKADKAAGKDDKKKKK